MTLREHDNSHETFRAARDQLLLAREDHDQAVQYALPRLEHFNWGLDWFDVVAGSEPSGSRTALKVVEDDGSSAEMTYAELASRSSQLAAWLQAHGVDRGDRLLLMLGNQLELWETLLACVKLGVVVIPASTLLATADLADRVHRGHVAHVVARSEDVPKFEGVPGSWTRIAVGDDLPGWLSYGASFEHLDSFTPEVATRADEPLLLYFTSGTTAEPKLVEHTHTSYPVGHLSTMYWIGLKPGDVHLNISSPGWAKHAWSNVFAPWNAEATVLVVNQSRFAAGPLLDVMADCAVTTFCAPPTVWRMLVQSDLEAHRGRIPLREVVGAGEPLNPEVIEQVERAWGLTVRDGYGQTETTAQIGNPPGAVLKPGSMGRPLPGYDVVLLDLVTGQPGDEGEICLPLDGPAGRPVGLMVGYRGDHDRNAEAMRGGAYHTGDVAQRDGDGYITYVGRSDDVFKASDYRISPFELESVLIEHPAVAEAAVVPSPEPTRLAVPKAYIVLAAGYEPTAQTAGSILDHARANLAPYKRIRRIEFAELPKTISGKIRRVELRAREVDLHGAGSDVQSRASATEFWEEDLPRSTGS
ncbi:AMP-binding protein [Angustibacter sp. McL0619]|uniref:AMP-binding protein n=1 Tax=Angustibacter sp. McL0619 TaxID=3415676 RepID=UPI003CF5C60D